MIANMAYLYIQYTRPYLLVQSPHDIDWESAVRSPLIMVILLVDSHKCLSVEYGPENLRGCSWW